MMEWVFDLKYLSVPRSTGDRNIQAETGIHTPSGVLARGPLGGAAGHG